ncbi:hypothetical protein GCM10022198_16050 [Klugiella xanthotipulae]|uniref:Ig-like protein group 1 n=1 Tax=Klugiella xanthotipulae TaxID=244735 RepID=A0A543HH49_9MICO|nr:M60 family metallopeptidase [Klugiella xanthotipulae]TQM57643.1 Ig-like protein group 1 [Klugiella xanthotipulae]
MPRITRRLAAASSLLIVASLIMGAQAASAAQPAQSPPSVPTVSVSAPANGTAAAAAARENRWMSHSELTPTGLFVRKGTSLTVSVTEGDPTQLFLGVGLIPAYPDFNGGKEVGISRLPLALGENTIEAAADGMVYVINLSGDTPATAAVTGGEQVPFFELGKMTQDEWAASLAAHPNAPFVEMVGARMFLTFRAQVVRDNLAGRSAADLMEYLDEVTQITNGVYGLDDNAVGVAHKSAHRVHLVNPEVSGENVYASATNDHLNFFTDSGAAARLLEGHHNADQWGLWHELGHTYQTPQYLWSGVEEVTVNIASLTVQEKLGYPNRLRDEKFTSKITSFLEKADGDRDYNTLKDPYTKLAMFEQLRLGFGNDFYPRVAQEFRANRALGQPDPATDAEKQQAFIRTASRVADRNLSEFFDRWGLAPSAETREEIGALPALGEPIWENLLGEKPVDEGQVGSSALPTGTLTVLGNPTILLGQTGPFTGPLGLDDLRSGNGTVTSGEARIVADESGPHAGTISVPITDSSGARNVLVAPVDVAIGNTVAIRQSNRAVGSLTLHPDTETIRVVNNGVEARAPFNNPHFAEVSLLSAAGEVKAHTSINRLETAAQLRQDFDNLAYAEGDFLKIHHSQPIGGLVRYDQGVPVKPASTDALQIFVIQSGNFVPVEELSAPTPLAHATVGVGYDVLGVSLSAGNAVLAGGSLPEGITFDPATGRVTGTPTTAGVYTFKLHLSGGPEGEVSTSRSITVVGGEPSLGESGTSTLVATDGELTSIEPTKTVTVTIRDAAGNPLPGVAVTLSGAAELQFSRHDLVTDEAGNASTLVGSTVLGTFEVSARVGDVVVGTAVSVDLNSVAPEAETPAPEGGQPPVGEEHPTWVTGEIPDFTGAGATVAGRTPSIVNAAKLPLVDGRIGVEPEEVTAETATAESGAAATAATKALSRSADVSPHPAASGEQLAHTGAPGTALLIAIGFLLLGSTAVILARRGRERVEV